MGAEDDQQDLLEIWTLFSELSCRARQVADNTIATSELPTLIRALGQNPSDTEVSELYQKADPMGTGVVHYNSFLQLAEGSITNREQEITEAFRVFDKDGKGTIHTADMRHIMTALGEKFDDIEVDEMIREAGVKGRDGDINYEEFSKKLTST
ncbi:Calmodulin [Diplonema papillatum]|nr:Calmodulin [Diplonema papillatum]